ncbi:hypothetical protein SFRURICE_010057, partial [Spodoptera frugiperda]
CYVRVLGDEVNGVLPIELRNNSLRVLLGKDEYKNSWMIENNKDVLIQEDIISSKEDKCTTSTGKFPTYPKYYVLNNLSDINTLPLQIVFKVSAYRASILQYNKTKGLVRIRYVDHGATDVIPVADIRELSTKWLKHPPTNFYAKSFGIHLNRDKYINVVAQHCIELLKRKAIFKVNILGYEGTVPLVDVRYSSGDWVPATLVKHDIFLNRTVISNLTNIFPPQPRE